MIPARRAWRNPAGSVPGRCRCPVCGPVLAPAGRWQAGWLGVGWGRVRGLGGRWWPLVAGGGRVGVVLVGPVCYTRARARARYLYCIHDTVIFTKLLRNFLKNFTKIYSEILQKLTAYRAETIEQNLRIVAIIRTEVLRIRDGPGFAHWARRV